MQVEDIQNGILMASVMCLHISMEEEALLKHTMPSVIYVNFSQLIKHCVTHRHAPHNTIEHTHAKILVNANEFQVPWDDNSGEVVDH